MRIQYFEHIIVSWQDTLEEYLKTIDCTISDFYQEVKATQETQSSDPYLSKFIECLLASAGSKYKYENELNVREMIINLHSSDRVPVVL